MLKILSLIIFLFGCSSPTTDKQIVEIASAANQPSYAYIITPDLMRYDVSPSGVTLKTIAHFNRYQQQVYFFTDSLIVVSEVIPWRDNRVSIVNTMTGQRRSWRYEPSCDYDGGRDQADVRTVREGGRLVTYWGCATGSEAAGVGYALDLKAWTLTSGPDIRIPDDPDVQWSATRSWVASDSPPSTLPAGYTLYTQKGKLAVVRDSSGAWALWDGARLFPLSVRTVLIPDLT